MPRSIDDRVQVKRPDGVELSIARAAWQGVYAYREGWTLVDDQPDLNKKTREQLDAIAVDKGLDPADYRTKADVIAALEDAK